MEYGGLEVRESISVGKCPKGSVAIRIYITDVNLMVLMMIREVCVKERVEFWSCREEKGGRKRKMRKGFWF